MNAFTHPILSAPEPVGRLRTTAGFLADAEQARNERHDTHAKRMAIGRDAFQGTGIHAAHEADFARAYAAITRPFGGR